MAYFPIYTDIKDKKILIIGGGRVALRKLEKLLPFEPKITVAAPEVCDEILKSGVEIINRKFRPEDLDGVFFAVNAVGCEELDKCVFNLCGERKILLNTVDKPALCTFIFSATVCKNGVSAAFSTSGKSPLYARKLKEMFIDLLDGLNPDTVGIMEKYRPLVKQTVEDENKRKRVFSRLLDLCLENRKINEQTVLRLIGEVQNEA